MAKPQLKLFERVFKCHSIKNTNCIQSSSHPLSDFVYLVSEVLLGVSSAADGQVFALV